MNIDTLMQHVRPVIRERGAQYYAKGKIKTSGEAQTTLHRAMVQGSQADTQYLVEIIYTPTGHVVSHCCTCPYEAEDLCKHQVAVLTGLKKQVQLKLEEKRGGEIADSSKEENSIYDTESIPGENLEKLMIHLLRSDSLLHKIYIACKQYNDSEPHQYESKTPYLDWLRPPASDGFGDVGGE